MHRCIRGLISRIEAYILEFDESDRWICIDRDRILMVRGGNMNFGFLSMPLAASDTIGSPYHNVGFQPETYFRLEFIPLRPKSEIDKNLITTQDATKSPFVYKS